MHPAYIVGYIVGHFNPLHVIVQEAKCLFVFIKHVAPRNPGNVAIELEHIKSTVVVELHPKIVVAFKLGVVDRGKPTTGIVAVVDALFKGSTIVGAMEVLGHKLPQLIVVGLCKQHRIARIELVRHGFEPVGMVIIHGFHDSAHAVCKRPLVFTYGVNYVPTKVIEHDLFVDPTFQVSTDALSRSVAVLVVSS